VRQRDTETDKQR